MKAIEILCAVTTSITETQINISAMHSNQPCSNRTKFRIKQDKACTYLKMHLKIKLTIRQTMIPVQYQAHLKIQSMRQDHLIIIKVKIVIDPKIIC